MEHRITTVCPIQQQLWVGTGSASVHVFSVSSLVADPEGSIMQLAQHSEDDQLIKSLNIYVHKSDEEGLVGRETGIEASPTQNPDRSLTEYHQRQHPYRFNRKSTFGRTFRKEVRREASRGESSREQEVYQLTHVTSSKVLLSEPSDSARVIGISPIRYSRHNLDSYPTDRAPPSTHDPRSKGCQFVVTCVNSTSCSEKAMKLWQCDGSDLSHVSSAVAPGGIDVHAQYSISLATCSLLGGGSHTYSGSSEEGRSCECIVEAVILSLPLGPPQWSFSSYNKCYDTVASSVLDTSPSTPMIERSRAYSTVLGTQPNFPDISANEEEPQSDLPPTIYEL